MANIGRIEMHLKPVQKGLKYEGLASITLASRLVPAG